MYFCIFDTLNISRSKQNQPCHPPKIKGIETPEPQQKNRNKNTDFRERR